VDCKGQTIWIADAHRDDGRHFVVRADEKLSAFVELESAIRTAKHMKQISYGKQRETKNSTPEIEVMTNAMLQSPIHPRKQVECFGDMSEDDYHEARCAD